MRIRTLDGIEAGMAWRHALLRGTSQATNLLTIEGIVAPENLKAAFERAYDAYEVLKLRIFEEGGSLHFVTGASFPDLTVYNSEGVENEVEKILEREINNVLDHTLALWRYGLVHDLKLNTTHIILTRHHAISDGFTGEHLLAAVLRDIDPGSWLFQEQRSYAFTVGPEALLLANSSSTEQKNPQSHADEANLWFPHFVASPLAARSTGVVSEVVTKLLLDQITSQCSRLGISVHSLISTTFARIVSEVADLSAINLFTAMSIRKLLSVGSLPCADFGCFIGVSRTPFERRVEPLVYVTNYAKELKSAVYQIRPDHRSQTEIRKKVEQFYKAETNRGVMVTNLGSLTALRAATTRKILDYRATSNRNGGLFLLGLHITFLEGVRLTLTFTRPLTDDVFVQTVLNCMIARLKAIALKGIEEGLLG